MAIQSVRAVAPVRPLVRATAKPAAVEAPKAPSTAKVATVGGAVTGAGIATAAYVTLGWFRNINPVMAGVAAVGVGLAALGGSKIGAWFDRGGALKKLTVGGTVGGALALVGFGGGAVMLSAFGSLGLVPGALLAAGAGLAVFGGAALGRKVQEMIVK